MESVLHISSISRPIEAPISIGHTEYLHYGEHDSDHDDPKGISAATMRLGYPLEMVDSGSTNTQIPLVKTIESMPDPSRPSGNIYLETIHYFKDQKHLIPIRTKMQSGPSQGLRITHLPSLAFARSHLSGDSRRPVSARSEIIPGLLEHDTYFTKNKNHPIVDWVSHEMNQFISDTPISDISFSGRDIGLVAQKFASQVKSTPYEINSHHIKDVVSTISLNKQVLPLSYHSQDVLHKTVAEAKLRVAPHNLDLRCYGRIPVENIPRLAKNTYGFERVLDLIDRVPLTDFNLDLVVGTDCSVQFFHENLAVNRLAMFADNELGSFSSESLLCDLLDPDSLKTILHCFLYFHPHLTEEVKDILTTQPVKLKLIKTLNDEAIILLYRHNARSDEEPLCGAYFDIAIQSLAPLSIMPQAVGF